MAETFRIAKKNCQDFIGTRAINRYARLYQFRSTSLREMGNGASRTLLDSSIFPVARLWSVRRFRMCYR